jgi:hypothetical protein
MSNRAIRRAAERQAMKAAAQSSNISDAQLAANRVNAQFSTGPKSENGKLVSSHNALKTGLTIVLPTDDISAYQSLVALMNKKFAPADDYEKHLVQTIADTEWRLLRIPTLEAGLYALGRAELAAECPAEIKEVADPQLRAAMLEAHIFRRYQKDLRNLALQERRLRNQLKHDTAELRRLQEERLAEAEEEAEPKPSSIRNGFEFSTPLPTSAPQPAPAPRPAAPEQITLKSEAIAA